MEEESQEQIRPIPQYSAAKIVLFKNKEYEHSFGEKNNSLASHHYQYPYHRVHIWTRRRNSGSRQGRSMGIFSNRCSVRVMDVARLQG